MRKALETLMTCLKIDWKEVVYRCVNYNPILDLLESFRTMLDDCREENKNLHKSLEDERAKNYTDKVLFIYTLSSKEELIGVDKIQAIKILRTLCPGLQLLPAKNLCELPVGKEFTLPVSDLSLGKATEQYTITDYFDYRLGV